MTSHCISIALIKRRLKEEKRNTALTQSHTEYISRLLILNSEPHKKTLKLVSEVKKKVFSVSNIQIFTMRRYSIFKEIL